MKIKFLTILTTLALGASLAVAEDAAADKPAKKGMDPAAVFAKLDSNGDGKISLDEFKASPKAKKDPAKAEKYFNKKDTDKDGSLSLEEFSAKPQPKAKKPAAEKADADNEG